MRKIIGFLFIFFHILLFSEELFLTLRTNLMNDIYSLKNVELFYENNIPVYYSLRKLKYNGSNVDLYISFDEKLTSPISNYEVIYKNLYYTEKLAISKKAGYFIDENHRIELIGNQHSFFKSDVNLSSFSISFWIYPLNYSKEEEVLKIGSQYYNVDRKIIENQFIICKIKDGKLIWDFQNVFSKWESKASIELVSYNRLLPEKWSHINLTYNAFTGLITVYINGREEAIAVASRDGSIYNTRYDINFEKTSRCVLKIASSFHGAIDEFYILKEGSSFKNDIFSNVKGEIISKVYEFKERITINEIKTFEEKTEGADIYYFIRYSKTPFSENESDDILKWERIDKNFSFNEIKYLQWKAILFLGKDQNCFPMFKGIKICYNVNKRPNKPSGLKVMLENNMVKLKWIPNAESDIKGYKIYYGSSSGSYFGNEANEGKSPIDIGLRNNFTLTGLNPENLYFFAITAYDDEEHMNESDFSDEVFIRPYYIGLK